MTPQTAHADLRGLEDGGYLMRTKRGRSFSDARSQISSAGFECRCVVQGVHDAVVTLGCATQREVLLELLQRKATSSCFKFDQFSN